MSFKSQRRRMETHLIQHHDMDVEDAAFATFAALAEFHNEEHRYQRADHQNRIPFGISDREAKPVWASAS